MFDVKYYDHTSFSSDQWRLQGGARGGHGPLWQISGPPLAPPFQPSAPHAKYCNFYDRHVNVIRSLAEDGVTDKQSLQLYHQSVDV